jgi:excisionase family DNA binding protein
MSTAKNYERDAYSVGELHQITGFPRSTLYEAIERNEIPAIRVGNRLRVPGYWLRQQLSPPQCT